MAYSGWSNYETWNIALWLDNEQGSQRMMSALAQECYDNSEDSGTFTREERAALTLAAQIKDFIEENAPDLGSSCYSDMLNAALSEVDYHEIAGHYLEEVDKEAEEETEATPEAE